MRARFLRVKRVQQVVLLTIKEEAMSGKLEASWAELLSGRNGLRSLALAGGVAVHAVNVYIATTIMPSVIQDIGGQQYYAWNTTLFVVASIVGSALTSRILERWGLRLGFLLTLAIFTLGTVLCASSPHMWWLLLARAVQGFGGGLLLGLSYSSIRIVFAERLWPKAMALVSSMWGVATLAGPAIGGVFAQSGHWRWAFLAILPLIAGLVVLVWTQLNAYRQSLSQSSGSTLPQIFLLTSSVLLVSGASLFESWGINFIGAFLGMAVLAYLIRFDGRASTRLFPVGTYSLRQPLGSLYACIGLMSISVTAEIFIPYFLQVIHLMSPLKAGYLTVLMSAGWTLGTIASSSRPHRVGAYFLVIGPVLSCISLLALAVLIPWQALSLEWQLSWLMYPALLGVGLGIGICWPHLLTRVFKAAPKGQENIASAAITTLQLYAMALGASVAGLIANAAGFSRPGGLIGAQQSSMALFIAFALCPALAAFLSKAARRVVLL